MSFHNAVLLPHIPFFEKVFIGHLKKPKKLIHMSQVMSSSDN